MDLDLKYRFVNLVDRRYSPAATIAVATGMGLLAAVVAANWSNKHQPIGSGYISRHFYSAPAVKQAPVTPSPLETTTDSLAHQQQHPVRPRLSGVRYS